MTDRKTAGFQPVGAVIAVTHGPGRRQPVAAQILSSASPASLQHRQLWGSLHQHSSRWSALLLVAPVLTVSSANVRQHFCSFFVRFFALIYCFPSCILLFHTVTWHCSVTSSDSATTFYWHVCLTSHFLCS